MIKLRKLIFEGVSPETFVTVMDVRGNLRYPLIAEIPDVQKFYDINKEKIDRILQGATEFKFLGAGQNGSAFSLGNNQVLKIETSSRRAEEIAAHYAAERKTGLYLPAIYDFGKLKTEDNQELSYAIIEKMEAAKENMAALEHIITPIAFYMQSPGMVTKDETGKRIQKPYTPAQVESQIKATKANIIKDLEVRLRLEKNWLKKLIKHMYKLRDMNISDFNAGNVGVRRMGGEGYLVFFD